MHMFTVATHNEGYLDALCRSCHRHGFWLHVLGWGQPWKGFVWKLGLFKRAVEEHMVRFGADDLVCIVDAYDVLVLTDCDELRRRYHRHCQGKPRILFAVENPLGEMFAHLLKCAVFGTCGLHNAPLNSGVCVGPALQCVALLDAMMAHSERTGIKDDQILLNQICRSHASMLAIDTLGDVFFHATCTVPFPGLLTGVCDLGLDEGLRNPKTNRVPCILHAPGGLSLQTMCASLDLPPGIRRPRWTWLCQNFPTPGLVLFFAFLILVLLCVLAFRRR